MNFHRRLQTLNARSIFPSGFAQYKKALEKSNEYSDGHRKNNPHLGGVLFINRELIHIDSPVDQKDPDYSPQTASYVNEIIFTQTIGPLVIEIARF